MSFVCCNALAYGQTKMQTIDWLMYNLPRKFGVYNLSPEDKNRSLELLGVYSYYVRDFSFNKDTLLIHETEIYESRNGEKGHFIHLIKITMSNIKQIYFEPKEKNKFKSYKLVFDFANINQPNVADVNLRTGTNSVKDQFFFEWNITTDNDSVFEDSLNLRFVKALKHLAKLCGSNLVEDVF